MNYKFKFQEQYNHSTIKALNKITFLFKVLENLITNLNLSYFKIDKSRYQFFDVKFITYVTFYTNHS